MGELGLTLDQLVADALPAGFSVATPYIEHRTKVWAMLLWEGAGVPAESKYDITVWPDEWVLLLSYLIVYDVLSRVLIGNFTSVLSDGGGEEGEGGGVKRIVTGPTEVEFHDNTTALSKLMTSMSSEDGFFTQFLTTACALGSKLGIQLPFCARQKAGSCFIVIKPYIPHAGFNGITEYAQNKPKSLG
jgi:hypothetical protein